MSIEIDIKKKLAHFTLEVSLKADTETIGLLGASGCGKSMTLKCIAGIEKPDEGNIILNGRTVFDSAAGINLKPQERRAGYLFQNYALFPTMTASQNIEIACTEKNAEVRKEIVSSMIRQMRLDGHEHTRPARLSGGQQQRVALARMLVSSPCVIMLDEPFSALDTFIRSQVEQELVSSLSQFKGTILLVSHNRDEIFRMCSRIAVMADGKIESEGTRDSVFENPRTVTAARLTGCKNIASAQKKDDHHIFVPEWGLTLETSAPVDEECRYAGIRAHHIRPPHHNDEPNTFDFFVDTRRSQPFSVSEYLYPFSPTHNTVKSSVNLVPLCREYSADEGRTALSFDENGLPDSGFTKLCIPPEKILLLK